MGNIFPVSIPCDPTANFCCWAFLSQQANYISKLGENLEALDRSLQELTALKNDLVRRVEVAELQSSMMRLDMVQLWIKKAETIETRVREVQNCADQEIQKSCSGVYCSKNYFPSYKYGKKVFKLLVEVDALKRKGSFEEVATESLQRVGVVYEMPTEQTVGMESMFDEVWRHVEDEQVGTIGLYGMGGVGKTTLLTKIHNKFAFNTYHFDPVIWIVVSKDHTLGILQDKIGEKLGILNEKWKHKEPHEKAQHIFNFLNEKKFVLLLDDIWEPIEIIKVGIPNPAIPNPEKVGKETLQSHPDIPKLAQVVANECDGLPLAIITVGRAMTCKKTPHEWKHAIRVLKESASEFSTMGDKLKACVRLKYLDLEHMDMLDFVPQNLISSFPVLKVFRTLACGSSDRILFDGEGALMEEIQGLEYLEVLTLSVRSSSCFQKLFSYHKLVTRIQTLQLSDGENQASFLDISSLVDMKHLDTLYIRDTRNWKQLEVCWAGRAPNDPRDLMMIKQNCFLCLQCIEVSRCPNLTDLTWLIFAPNLCHLRVEACSDIEKIINLERLGGVGNVVQELNPFGKLTVLILIFPASNIRQLSGAARGP
ncbi:hypothetical protein C1H46_017419 [Malus baccata]|uniref:NB-ARC domain-containing protein n=1 Tax=Malus baccata TaxID=106549 RepID=A0A540MEU7_MALBA|nr:hypothetical protein C1H46_017419 [Malus baccata]